MGSVALWRRRIAGARDVPVTATIGEHVRIERDAAGGPGLVPLSASR
jgi:hypothetical protein